MGAEGSVSAENIVGVSRETLHWRYGTAFGFETRENRRGRGREMLVLSTPANIFEKVALSHGMQRSVKIDRIEYFDRYLVKKDGVLIDNKTNTWFQNLSKDTWAIMMNCSEIEGEAIYAR